MIFSRGRGRDEGLGGFSVGGETETRVSTYLGDGGEVEGPKIAISTSRVSKFETPRHRGWKTADYTWRLTYSALQ